MSFFTFIFDFERLILNMGFLGIDLSLGALFLIPSTAASVPVDSSLLLPLFETFVEGIFWNNVKLGRRILFNDFSFLKSISFKGNFQLKK